VEAELGGAGGEAQPPGLLVELMVVAAATLRAIDKPKAEIVVNRGPGRLLKALMDYFPAWARRSTGSAVPTS
jgi:hypothetical protein